MTNQRNPNPRPIHPDGVGPGRPVMKESIVARSQIKVKVSKSARLRTILEARQAAGTLKGSLADVARQADMGYAFAYGVADRFAHPDGGSYADHAASRRESKAVTIKESTVEIRPTSGGVIRVDLTTGKVTRSKT